MDVLKEIIGRDPLSEVSEQEKELLWRMRYVKRGIILGSH